MFKKVHIVRKLNAADSPRVVRICTAIEQVVAAYKGFTNTVLLVDEHGIDAETLVIAVGGDGTMLEAMRLAQESGATATGINLGNVGFLTDFRNHDLVHRDVEDFLYGTEKYPVEERIALQYSLADKLETTQLSRPAFNELVLSNKYSDSLIQYKLFIGDRCAGVHRANALIVGTPTGSTAYTLSAGGGLLLPSMEAMQIVPVAPISMTSRPIIIPSYEDVRLSIETKDEWIIKSDGLTIATFEANKHIDTQISITQCEKKVRILHSKYWSFFDMLTQKLGWKSS